MFGGSAACGHEKFSAVRATTERFYRYILVRPVLQRKMTERDEAMQDEMIVDMYWRRNEKAIEETAAKYGGYLFKIAKNILEDEEDSKESVNDTYLKTWKSIPPNRPDPLLPYLSKIVRRTSIDIFRGKNREKRRGSQYEASLCELAECVSKGDETAAAVDCGLLSSAINDWLLTLPAESRAVFIGRYYFMDPIKDLTEYHGMSSSKVKSLLFRLRASLREYLEKEGFEL